MKKYLYLTIFIFSVLLVAPRSADAATVRLHFDEATFDVNGQAIVQLLVAPSEQKINALGGELKIVSGKASFKEIKSGDSIISAWLENPQLKKDTISFSGIIPGGFSGLYSPFKKELQPGIIMAVVLTVEEPGTVVLAAQNMEVYADNGELQALTLEPNQLKIDFKKSSSSVASEMSQDITPPVNMFMELIKLPAGPEGWFVVFSAEDYDSGIDHYEIQETLDSAPDPLKWKLAESPFRLEDQSRRSSIFVKAIDHSGQELMASIPPAETTYMVWYLVAGIAAVALLLAYGLYRYRRRV